MLKMYIILSKVILNGRGVAAATIHSKTEQKLSLKFVELPPQLNKKLGKCALHQ